MPRYTETLFYFKISIRNFTKKMLRRRYLNENAAMTKMRDDLSTLSKYRLFVHLQIM